MSVALGKRTYEILNKQVTEEFASSYLYLGMASVLSDMGLDGCAHWMKLQAEEECTHAMRIFDHLIKRGVKVKLLPVQASKQEWRAPLHIFEEMARHEQRITLLMFAIYEAAIADKDYATLSFIQWFIDEQVEEEATAKSLLDRLRKMQSSELGVMQFDMELGQRK